MKGWGFFGSAHSFLCFDISLKSGESFLVAENRRGRPKTFFDGLEQPN